MKKSITFALAFSGCSAVRLAHLLWEQGVASSNLATPTRKAQTLNKCLCMMSFCCRAIRRHFLRYIVLISKYCFYRN